jgi:signal peptide peptidase SppA
MLAIRAAALSIEFACLDSGAKPFECVDGVAIVKIEGPLTQRSTFIWDSYESIRPRVAAAFADSSSRAVMLEINSPGGVVDGVFELAADLRAMALANPTKRFVAFTDSMAASAAYAIASAAPEIFVSSTGQVGSIGVINALVDTTALDKAQGVKFSVIASGERKRDGNPHVAISEEAEDVMRSNVNALASIFFETVNRARPNVSAADLQSLDGALFFGTHAVKVGLANGVTTKSDLLASLAQASTASAVTPKGSAMADEDKDKKSYEDEMRARLEEDVKSDDDKKSSAAKKMLAALDGDEKSDEDKKKEADAKAKAEADEKEKAKAEEEKKDGDAKALAAQALTTVNKLSSDLAAERAARAADDLDRYFASVSIKLGGHVTEEAEKIIRSQAKTLEQAKALVALIPAPAFDPNAAARVSPTRGDRKDQSSRLPPAEASAMAEAMGMTTASRRISREGTEVIFPAMTPAEAKAQLDERAKSAGGVK